MGLLAPVLQNVLKWSEAQYGYIIMSFQVAYAIGYVTSGRIMDVIGTRLGYAAAVLIWSIASCMHALVGTVVGFAVVGSCLGWASRVTFLRRLKSTVDYFPAEERALATGLLNSGMNVAVQITPLFIPWIVFRWGWHAAFLATGLLGFLWLAVWMAFPYDRLRPQHIDRTAVSYGECLAAAARAQYVGLLRCQISDGHDLVVLSILAA